MGDWLRAARSAASEVGDRPPLWIPGALAWSVSVGWIALVAGVIRPPSAGELTFFGAGIATSGLWPWNLVIGIAAAAMLVVAAFALAALAETVLIRAGGAAALDLRRALMLAGVCAAPVAVLLLFVGTVVPLVAQGEFNAPMADGDPVLRTLARVSPLLAAVLVAAVAGAAVHAAALRDVEAGPGSIGAALGRAPARLARLGGGGVVHAMALAAMRIGHLVLAAILLRVLWDPIGGRLTDGGIDLATILLLVGFVAIWLCLVLSGGALHAWGSVTWTRLLAVEAGGAATADSQHLERRPGP
jgi:hypothetical protein